MLKLSPKTILGAVGVLALLVASNFLKGPPPHIALPAEKVFAVFGFPITNTYIASWLTIVVLVGLSWAATRKMAAVPRGVQNLVEAFIELFLNFVEGIAGRENARRFFPVVTTIFLFVITSAYLSLLPGFTTIGIVKTEEHGQSFKVVEIAGLRVAFVALGAATVTEASGEESAEGIKGELVAFLRGANTELNTPMALAVLSAIFVEYWGISTWGLRGYSTKFFNFRQLRQGRIMMGFVDIFVGFMELVSELARLISFTFRLFGNMFAGEVLLGVITFLIPLVAVLLFFGLELLVGFVQALVFAGLTVVFGVVAVAGHGEEH
ncbi:MAG: F0F1 ATP synthase subunit A [Chloroflexi bacterium]|nr:F0F1 ATP synthase subunit A [Chloroflexota bacterium]